MYNNDTDIRVMLKSNYKNSIRPTNEFRNDEYERFNLIPSMLKGVCTSYQLDGFELHLGLMYHVHHFFLTITVYDDENYLPTNCKDLPIDIVKNIASRAVQFIDDLNDNNMTFISFEHDDPNNLIQIFDGKIYGLIYDIKSESPIDPPKLVKHELKIEPISYDDIITAFRK